MNHIGLRPAITRFQKDVLESGGGHVILIPKENPEEPIYCETADSKGKHFPVRHVSVDSEKAMAKLNADLPDRMTALRLEGSIMPDAKGAMIRDSRNLAFICTSVDFFMYF